MVSILGILEPFLRMGHRSIPGTETFYCMESKTGTIKPGKTVKIKGVTWSDYKIKNKIYVDAYYVK